MSSISWLEPDDHNTSLDTPQSLVTTTVRSYYVPGHLGAETISEKTAEDVQWIFVLIMIPFVSLPGILGNVSSLVILFRHGFKKTSNILLAALTLADACYLIGVNNVASFIHEYSPVKGFHYSVAISYFLYGLYRFYFLLEWWGNWCSLTMPVLITVERLVAVYFPFRFPMIITPFRTWTAVIIVYIMWIPINVYYFFLEELIFVNDTSDGNKIGLITRTHLYKEEHLKEIYRSVNKAAIILTEPVPIALVVVGCVMVGIRVKTASNKRRKMMSAVTSVVPKARVMPAFRTTWTLMLVCIVYTCTIGTAFIIQLFNNEKGQENLDTVLEVVVRFVKCIHSSCNFYIYIYVNRNFRDTYRSVFGSFVNGTRKKPESETSPSV